MDNPTMVTSLILLAGAYVLYKNTQTNTQRSAEYLHTNSIKQFKTDLIKTGQWVRLYNVFGIGIRDTPSEETRFPWDYAQPNPNNQRLFASNYGH